VLQPRVVIEVQGLHVALPDATEVLQPTAGGSRQSAFSGGVWIRNKRNKDRKYCADIWIRNQRRSKP
jgi:hypothetical protein